MISPLPLPGDRSKNHGKSLQCESGCDASLSIAATSRRWFLRTIAGGTVAGLASAAGWEVLTPKPVLAQSTLAPDAALARLMEGNGRFAHEQLTSPAQNLAVLRQHTIEKQEPFAAVLSCADSRVPVELIFDQSINDIFVVRIAGNIATTEVIASLEYGAAVLGTKLILVMGHGGCGAVKATIQGKEAPGLIGALYPHIEPAVIQAGHDLDAVIKANAKFQASLLRESSTVISGLVKENKLKVVASYYDLASGIVTRLE